MAKRRRILTLLGQDEPERANTGARKTGSGRRHHAPVTAAPLSSEPAAKAIPPETGIGRDAEVTSADAESPAPESIFTGAQRAPQEPTAPAVVSGQSGSEASAVPGAEEWTLPKLIARWKPAPWLFARECVGMEPDLWQDVILHAVVGQQLDGSPLPEGQPFDKIALKACKGPGKTCVEAVIILWFLTCFEDPKVVCTSITGDNLRTNLWTELALWINKSDLLKQLFEWTTTRITLRERPATWYAEARAWPKDAEGSKQAETLAGIHGRNTLLVLDESGSIPEGVLVAGLAHHGTQSKDAHGVGEVHITLQCGNPTQLDGALGVACTRDRARWFVYEITGDPDDPHRAPRIDIEEARSMINTWGRDHDWVRVNVFGQFPRTQGNKMVGPEEVRAAMTVVISEQLWKNRARLMGLDVARSLGSDRSTLCRRQGAVVYPFRVWRYDDLMQLVGAVAHEAREYKPIAIYIDMIGLGSGVLDRLRELGFPAIGVNSSLPSADSRFENKRAEMWFGMTQEIKGQNKVPRLMLPEMPELQSELTAPAYKFSKRGKMMVESKDDMKKRGVPSPDVADALALTFAEPIFEDVMPATDAARLRVPAGFASISVSRNADNADYDPYAREI